MSKMVLRFAAALMSDHRGRRTVTQKDPDAKEPRKGVGLGTLRLDGFVSVETKKQGTLTTKPLLFLGDTLVVNADPKDGSLVVEALDAVGKTTKG